MRVRVNLTIRRLPIIYRHRFVALIKEALNHSDYIYKSSLYPENSTKISKRTKPFTFSVYVPPGSTKKKEKFLLDQDLVVEEDVFIPSSDVSFFISSCDQEFMVNLCNGLLSLKKFEFMEFIDEDGGTKKVEYAEIKNVFLLNERTIENSEVMFKTMSYISIEDENDRPLEIFKDGAIDSQALESFNYHLNAIQDRRFKDLRGYGLKQPLVFVPKQISKKVVKHTLKGFRDQTDKPFMMLTTYHGTFILKGDPEDLQLTYQVGLGLRTGQGFGMLEVV